MGPIKDDYDKLKERVINGELCNMCRVEMSPKNYLWCFPSGVSDRHAKLLFGLEAFDLLIKTLPGSAFEESTDVDSFAANFGFALNPDTMDSSVYLIVDKEEEEKLVFESKMELARKAIAFNVSGSDPPKPN